MYTDLNHPKHQSQHTKIVKKVLKQMAKESGEPYPSILSEFVGGEENLGMIFWATLWETSGTDKKYNDVYYCPSCRMFDLSYDPQGPNVKDLERAMEEMVAKSG